MADLATSYDHVERMRLIPYDVKALAVLLAAALVPMIPLGGTQTSLQELFIKLGEIFI